MDARERLFHLSPKRRELLRQRLIEARGGASSGDRLLAKQLVAYLLMRADASVTPRDLRAFLKERLPEYMVPSAFVYIDELPLTASGKLDLRALPEPGIAEHDGHEAAPRSPAEQLMAGVWCDVLARPSVGVFDNFFELGGHSLLAVQIVSRAREVLGTELPVRAIFEAPTVAELTTRALVARGDTRALAPPISRAARGDAVPLTYEQRALWLTEQITLGTAPYNMPAAMRLTGKLDVIALERTLDALTERHEILRTTFEVRGGDPVQVIHPPRAARLAVIEVIEPSAAALERRVLELATEVAEARFDLARGPAMMVKLLRLSPEDHVLLTSMHHIVADGWALATFVRELAAVYAAFAAGEPSPLPELPIQYADYAIWQQTHLRADVIARELAWWKEQLAGAPTVLELPTDRPRPPVQTFAGAVHSFTISARLTSDLRALSRRHGATLFMTMLAAFNVLLSRYTGQSDILLGMPVANRSRKEAEDVMGLFVNTLVLRTKLDDSPTFMDLLARVREAALGAYSHQDLPFDLLVEALEPARDPSRTPLFQVMCELQNMPPASLELTSLTLRPVEAESRTAKFDLLLVLNESPDVTYASFEYSTDLFDAATIARLASHLEVLLESIVASPRRRVGELEILGKDERKALISDVNRTDLPWDTQACFHGEFEAQATRTPDAVAVVCDERRLTYAELNAAANRVGRALLGAAVPPESIVAIVLDRGIEFLAAMLGVFKAGLAYVPLDPALPRARLRIMLEQARCAVVLSDEKHGALAREIAEDRALVIDVAQAIGAEAPSTNLDLRVDPRALAYMIFTSGSTGTPKGAMIEHRGMLNHLRAKVHDLGVTAADCIAQTATQSFDVSVWQFLTALLAGGRTAVFRGESAWEPSLLMRQLACDGVTIFETVPTHTVLILDELDARPGAYDLSGLRWFIINGEPLLPDLCDRWFARYPAVPLINAYGPTECSDDIAHYQMRGAAPRHCKYVPISGTLPNMRVYVLDRYLQPVPCGVAGELYIGGIGVGRGYVNDPEKTARSFIPDPFSAGPTARLYRTGDCVRYRADGSIEFIGRSDHQVKIRGFRIEIGEIEAAISGHGGVEESVVLARRDGDEEARLVAYVVRRADAAVSAGDLAEHLRARLAAYMVPSAFVFMDAFPLLTSGKVDRHRLPTPQGADATVTADYIAPRTLTEQLVAQVWAEQLGVERVGAGDNFFDLGGHSLVALRTIARVRAALDVELTVRALFERPTVTAIAALIDELKTKSVESSTPSAAPGAIAVATVELHDIVSAAIEGAAEDDRSRPHDLAPHQLPEWYMHELEPTSPFYTVTINDVMFVGDLDVRAFVSAWQAIVDRHAVFRTYFQRVDGMPVQRVRPRIELRMEDVYVDRTSLSSAEVEAEVARLAREIEAPFDFESGPIFRVRLVGLPEQRFQLLFAIHHIVWDEASTMNLAREMAELYNAYRAERAPNLPEVALQYVDYAHAIKRAIEGGHFELQRQYWLSKLSPPSPALDLPLDFKRPVFQTFNGSTVSQWLSKETAQRVQHAIRRDKVTLNIFFLSVLNVLLYRLSGQADFVVGTPIANRDDERLEPLMGLFATAIPLRCTVARGATFEELLRGTRETAIEAYDNHLFPSVLAIQEINPDIDFSRSRLFSVMFGVQNNKTRLMSDLAFDGVAMKMLGESRVAEFETSKFDLTFVIDQIRDDIVVQLNFNTDLFKTSTAERLLRHFMSLVDQVLDEPTRRLIDYDLLSSEERALIERGLVSDAEIVAPEAALPAMLEAQAERTPSAIAVIENDREVDYRTLHERANRLARHLVDLGAAPEEKIAILLEPSVDLVVALLAVHKSGAAYVPISPGDPEERRSHILAASGACALITTSALLGDAAVPCPAVIRVDREEQEIAAHAAEPLAARTRPEQLAYVIFTSGTTGRPKGIAVEHRGLPNLVESTQRAYVLEEGERFLFLTPASFDASVLDVFWPLAYGATIVIAPEDARKSPRRVGALIREHRVTAFQCVPLFLQSFEEARAAGEIPDLPSLRFVICGGAAMGREQRDQFVAAFSGARLGNHYGPTEVTVDATRWDCRDDPSGALVPIGRPIANARVYVLDAAQRPAPIGVVGEIFVDSPGLARGYLDDPGRTAEAFVPNPFAREPGGRLYRTGDLGRVLEDGCLEYVGRVDKQVKIRGNRVEIEEIEVLLAAHPAVARCAVRSVLGDDSGDMLVAMVELREAILAIGSGEPRLRLFSLAQRPELRRQAEALHVEAWPAFFAGDCTLRSYWTRLGDEFPDCQFVIVDESDAVLATGNAIPISWDGTREGLPGGWDAALERGFVDDELRIVPNTYMILTGVASRAASGRGLAQVILQAHKALARALGYARVVVAVRPTGKDAAEAPSFEAWAMERRGDGQLADNWLRIHERVGGTIFGVELRSQHIRASVDDWRRWTGQAFESSGSYVVQDALQPVRIDLEGDYGEYFDPCVWVEHPLRDGEPTAYSHVDGGALRVYMRQHVPDYMIPSHVRIVGAMPLTVSGKIDEGALGSAFATGNRDRSVAPQTGLQKQLAGIWTEVLAVPSVGITDDFFDLGGHSIRAVEMLAKVTAAFHVELSLKELFVGRTIKALEKTILIKAEPAAAAQLTEDLAAPVSRNTARMPKATGVASGHHGEVIQAAVRDGARMHRALVTLPCPIMKSEVTFTPDRSGVLVSEPHWKEKAARAAKLALEAVNRSNWGGRLEIRSNIPIGWGLGSSTSDVLAAIRAVAAAAEKTLNAERIAALAVQAETASDSLMFSDRAVLFAHREGVVLDDFGGPLPALEVLGFNTDPHGNGIDTLAHPRARYSSEELETFRVALGLLRRAVRDQDPRLLGRVASASSRISQRHLPKPYFDRLEEVVDSVGALGIQVAHSGTVVGLLFDPSDPHRDDRIRKAKDAIAKMRFRIGWHFRTRES